MTEEELLYKFEDGKFWIGLQDWQILTLIAIIDKFDKYDDLEQLQGILIQCRNKYQDEKHFLGSEERFNKIMKLLNRTKNKEEVEENEST